MGNSRGLAQSAAIAPTAAQHRGVGYIPQSARSANPIESQTARARGGVAAPRRETPAASPLTFATHRRQFALPPPAACALARQSQAYPPLLLSPRFQPPRPSLSPSQI